MKSNWVSAVLTLTTSVLIACSSSAGEACQDLKIVDWLHGDWITDDGRGHETWTRLSDGTWEGTARVGGTVESLRMLAMGGEIFYLAKVDHNDEPTVFRLVECAERRAVFTNPEHDFPTRLEYVLKEGGVLVVRVTGKDDQGFRLSYRRTAVIDR